MKLTDFQVPAQNEEEMVFLFELANDLIEMLEDTEKRLAERVAAQMFDNDEYLALWGFLPAKVRTAIKRGGK